MHSAQAGKAQTILSQPAGLSPRDSVTRLEVKEGKEGSVLKLRRDKLKAKV